MDIEKLSKSQIVLLALLVSFVTSIATGIVTASLMQQAPPVVAQTVNRVVEETVAASSGQSAAVVTAQAAPEIVNDSDLAAQAIQSVAPSVVRLYAGTTTGSSLLSLGLVITSGGIIAADDSDLSVGDEAWVARADGSVVPASVVSDDAADGIAYLSAATSTASQAALSWQPASFANSSPELGETVIAISGAGATSVEQGIVSSLSTASTSQLIATSVTGAGILPGAPLIDLQGAIIGISTASARQSDPSSFLNASAIHAPDSTPKENESDTRTN